MKTIALSILTATLVAGTPARAATGNDDWPALGHALTLVEMFVSIAAHSQDPVSGLEAVDDILAGRNSEANRAMAGLLEEATADMPAQHRSKVATIGRDLVALARKEAGRAPGQPFGHDGALQARKDLTAMGLKYHDPNEFLEAVKRDDALAVELFIEGRGVNVGAKDKDGRSALEIARARGNEPMAQLLARNLRAAR